MTTTTDTTVVASGLIDKPRVAMPAALTSETAVSESFRLLALNVARLLDPDVPRSILVTSARPRSGCTMTAIGLARSLAELGEHVLLLDADPSGTMLSNNGAVSHLRIAAPARLGVPSQAVFVANVRELLAAGQLDGLTVVIDTPPCTSSSIAFQLAQTAGGVLYVARRRAEDPAVHGDIRGQLDLLGARILGVVFNES